MNLRAKIAGSAGVCSNATNNHILLSNVIYHMYLKELSNKQFGRITRNERFIADYNHLDSSTSPAGQDPRAWELEMVNRLKKDASKFKKRPIKEYLDY